MTPTQTSPPPLAEPTPKPDAHPSSPNVSALCVLLGVAGGVLLYLCHFPVAWGWLGWVALVPFLALVRSPARPRRIYLAAWLGGLVFYIPVLQWMRVADPRMYFTWIALALHCSLFVVLGVYLIRRLDRRTRLPLVLTVPVVWTALEFLRAHLLSGFPWYFLGHTQHDFLTVIQVADLTGAYGVSFVVAAVNVIVFEWLCAVPRVRQWLRLPQTPASRLPIGSTAFAALLVALVLGYGVWRLGEGEFAAGPRVALVQGNVPQGVRNTDGLSMLNHYSYLARVACTQAPKPDLIVWPETSYPNEWTDVAAGVPAGEFPNDRKTSEEQRGRIRADVTEFWPGNVLLGLNATVLQPDGGEKRYNSSLLFHEDGRVGPRYDKIHRVPFGEYVPFKDSLPFMKAFAPYDFDYSVSPGEGFPRFEVGKYRFGVVICYEDTDPTLARQYVAPGSDAVDFVVNVSNDGWFNGTAEHEEHLAICRFRAVECRRSVLRAVNMGISGVIDPNGRVLTPHLAEVLQFPKKKRPTGEEESESKAQEPEKLHVWDVPTGNVGSSHSWREFKKVAGVLTAEVPIDTRGSVYASWGDWLPWGCWVFAGVGLVWGMLRPRSGY